MRSRLACASLILLSAACHPRAIPSLDVTAPCLEAEAGKAGRNACRDAIANTPGEPKLHTRLAASHMALGQDAQALAELEHAIRLDPRNFEAHYGAGMVLTRMSRTEDALMHFRDARNIDASDPSVTWQIAYALRTLGQREEAFAEFRALVERDPNNSSAWSWMAISAAELGRHARGRSRMRSGRWVSARKRSPSSAPWSSVIRTTPRRGAGWRSALRSLAVTLRRWRTGSARSS